MKRLLSLLASLLLAAPAAQAQLSPDLIMETYNNNIQVITSGIINKDMLEKSRRNYEARGASRSTTTRGAATGAARPHLNLAYVPTAALRQQTVQEMGSKLQAKNPAAGKAFTAAFASGKADYSQVFREMVKPSGLPPDNAATAFAAYLEMGYAIVNKVQEEKLITPAMDRALQQQAAGILSQNQNLTSSVAVARLGEELKLQAVLLALGWQGARQGGQTEQFRTGIAQQFRSQGLDMSAVRLTTQGLVKK